MLPAATVDERLRSLTDLALATAAAAGERPAFEELYRRNVPAAWRVAHAVAGNRDDASDAVADAFERVFKAVTSGRLSENAAFRPYLLTATRRAAINITRRSCRAAPTDEMADLDGEAPAAGPHDRMVADLDAALLGRAFRQLPERWRSVLWLLEVEDLSAQEAGDVLGLRPNTVAQLAVRARMGLRKRYLAAHVSGPARPECTVVVERLGAYVEGTLGHRREARIDLHLRGCAACQRRRDEIHDLGMTLRRSVLPVPVGLAAVAAGGWHGLSVRRAPSGQWLDSVRQLPARFPGTGHALTWASSAGPDLSGGASAVERVVSWATAGVLVLGVSVGVVHTGGTGGGGRAAPPAAVTGGRAGQLWPLGLETLTTTAAGGDAVAAGTPTMASPDEGGALSGPPAHAPSAGPATSGDPLAGGAPGAPAAQDAVEAVTGMVPPLAPAGRVVSSDGVVDGVVAPLTQSRSLPTVPPVSDPRPGRRPASGGPVDRPPAVDPAVPSLGTPKELPRPPVTLPRVSGASAPPDEEQPERITP